MVGCCLLDITHIRPAPLPAPSGVTLRAAAHRISAEWTGANGDPVVGVYVPLRHSSSRLAVALGGRWFPGVHERARIDIAADADTLRWTIEPTSRSNEFGIAVVAMIQHDGAAGLPDATGEICLAANDGVSPDPRGELEGARMQPDRRTACAVDIDHIESPFLESFSSAESAPSYLMRDVGVTWTRASIRESRPRRPS